jgi:hypothetical protein
MGAAAHASRPRAARARFAAPRRPFRDAWVALVSAGVVALLVLYAVAAPTSELSASIGQPVPRPGSTAVVQGRFLEADGSPLAGAHVDVERAGGGMTAKSVSADDGTFRVEVSGGCSAYTISLRADAQGSPVAAESQRRICPGDAVPVVARVVTQGHFLWVPGPR